MESMGQNDGSPRANGCRIRRGRSAGFTLIELMIVVAIVAILAAVAYPAYTSSVVKGKRAQGRAALAELMIQQERYFTQNNSYLAFDGATSTTAGSDSTGTSVTPLPFKYFSGDNPGSAAYLLGARTCDAAAPAGLRSCVEVYAVPQYGDPAITRLTIRNTGAKDCTVSTGPKTVCWG